MSEYLTPREVMDRLKVGRSTVYQLFNTRNFPVLKLGRKLLVRSDLLDRFLNDNFRAEDQEHYA